jgi:hypothetical protein
MEAILSQQLCNDRSVVSEQGGRMDKRVECGCGWAFEGSDDGVVEAVENHCEDAHGGRVPSRQQILDAAKPVPGRRQ